MARPYIVYIAASWRHEHAVRMLTEKIRSLGIEVLSFVENSAAVAGLASKPNGKEFDEWVWSEDGYGKFEFDTNSAMNASALIYLGPSGTDAWAEVGAAWAVGVPVLGISAKGEQAGLMCRMVEWFANHDELLAMLKEMRDARCSAPVEATKA